MVKNVSHIEIESTNEPATDTDTSDKISLSLIELYLSMKSSNDMETWNLCGYGLKPALRNSVNALVLSLWNSWSKKLWSVFQNIRRYLRWSVMWGSYVTLGLISSSFLTAVFEAFSVFDFGTSVFSFSAFSLAFFSALRRRFSSLKWTYHFNDLNSNRVTFDLQSVPRYKPGMYFYI